MAHTDDEIFEQYPTWEEFKAAKFSGLKADDCFGGEGDIGGRNYAQCAQYGIGREPLAKMLAGTETRGAIEEALRNLPMTARRKRGIEQQIEEARREAEALRAEADRLEAERDAERQKAEALALEKQARVQLCR